MSTNTQILKGLRCPDCFSEGPFVIQVTMNVVMADDGIDWGMHQPEDDHFPDHPIAERSGLEPSSPIQCTERRGCGYYSTVENFMDPAAMPVAPAALATPAVTQLRRAESAPMEMVCEMLGEMVLGLIGEDGQTIQNPPGSNCGEEFSNDVFAIRDYCWCDGERHPWTLNANGEEDGPTCPPNFEHFASGVTGEWYKHVGRCTYFSREVSREEAMLILADCAASLGNQDTAAASMPTEAQRKRWAQGLAATS